MADRITPEERSENMRKIKGKDTKPEILVRKYLFSKGYRFRKNDKRYPGKPDLILPKYKTAIFINGCFWHQHPGCRYAYMPKSRTEFWKAKFERNCENDQKHYSELEKMGWKVIVIWECRLAKKIFDEEMLNLENKIKGD